MITFVFIFQYKVLLYISKQQQVTHARITPHFVFTVSSFVSQFFNPNPSGPNRRLSNTRWQQIYRVNFHCLRSSEHAHNSENNGFTRYVCCPLSSQKVSHYCFTSIFPLFQLNKLYIICLSVNILGFLFCFILKDISSFKCVFDYEI